MKDADQVREQGFPDTKFEFMHEVNNHHPGNIKISPELLEEGILSHIRLDVVDQLRRRALTTVGTEDVDLRTPSTPAPATACPNL